ncbi:MAG TPA: di-heme oxidoredictase family protein, partial [Isosphaeraceae bacterium]|nr:di-heme oxidoredictase family protein [Isosphaeraceae bacterium]
MPGNALTRARRKVGIGLAVFVSLGATWAVLPGLPVLRAPSARAEERAAGRELFVHDWQAHDPLAHGDGLGPVFNGTSCGSCHFQGGVGGGGSNDHNVLAFEAHPTKARPDVKAGLVHKFAIADAFVESTGTLRPFFPIVKGGTRTVSGCSVVINDFDPVKTESVNTSALFGAGWLDRISGKTIVQQYHKRAIKRIGREVVGDFNGVGPGRPRVLPDGRLGKFGWKAQFATLEEFVAAACANEIGLGNPRMEQAKPLVLAAYPKVKPDLDSGQFRSLVAYVDTLPRPAQVLPASISGRDEAERGKALFGQIGCAECHTPDVGGVEGVYSDFLLHRLEDPRQGNGGGYRPAEIQEVPLPEDHPLPEEWKTPPLWGVASSAPYFHDGKASTL